MVPSRNCVRDVLGYERDDSAGKFFLKCVIPSPAIILQTSRSIYGNYKATIDWLSGGRRRVNDQIKEAQHDQ